MRKGIIKKLVITSIVLFAVIMRANVVSAWLQPQKQKPWMIIVHEIYDFGPNSGERITAIPITKHILTIPTKKSS